MSLMRQLGLLLAATLLLALLASVGVTIGAARDTIVTQLQLQNRDNASVLAQVLSLQHGERESMRRIASAQFETGHYRSIRLVDVGGRAFFEGAGGPAPRRAPAWFVRWLPIEPAAGVARLADGWRPLGSVEVAGQTTFAHDALWRGSVRSALVLAAIGVLAGALAALGVARIRRPLDRAVEQAASLQRGEYRLLAEPAAPELRRLTRAMNALVERLRAVFENQAAQVEALRRHATCDPLTGLANRSHFMARLGAMLSGEDGPPAAGLVLLRLARLAELNASLGRERVDDLLARIAEALLAYQERADGAFCGRLNGADFALALPEAGVARETAEAILGLLRATLGDACPTVSVAAGGVETRRDLPLGGALGAADLALARAESAAPFTVEMAAPTDSGRAGIGESSWRSGLREALDAGAAQLGAFRVVDPLGRLLHLESPLRLRLDPARAPLVAAEWLPLALRSRLTAEVDELALALALAAIAKDGVPRAVNLSPASLRNSGFAARLAQQLHAAAEVAAKVWLEVHESAAAEHLELVYELGRQVRPAGARLGLEHAGERLPRIERLFEAGLDYVKLDAAIGAGVARDPARAEFVGGLVRMLHGLSIQAIAEGVAAAEDAEALLRAGVDGLTGPWIERTGGRCRATLALIGAKASLPVCP